MPRAPDKVGRPWPRLMRAETAAAYCDERSVEAFTARVGRVYPRSIVVSGRGRVWRKEDLDRSIANLSGSAADVEDAAHLL